MTAGEVIEREVVSVTDLVTEGAAEVQVGVAPKDVAAQSEDVNSIAEQEFRAVRTRAARPRS